MLEGRKKLSARAAAARLILGSDSGLKLPGAASEVEAALERKIPSRQALAGRLHWIPGDYAHETNKAAKGSGARGLGAFAASTSASLKSTASFVGKAAVSIFRSYAVGF